VRSVKGRDDDVGADPDPAIETIRGPRRAALSARLASLRQLPVLQRLRGFREGGLLLAILVAGVIFASLDSSFIRIANLSNISSQISFLGVLAVTMTFVLISGEIDLSIGSMVSLSGVIFGLLLTHDINIWVAVVLTLLAGCAMGAVNGYLSVLLRVPTIIITLGMLSGYRGLSYYLSNGYPVTNYRKAGAFFIIGQNRFRGVVPYEAIILLVFAVISGVALRHTVVGHRIYATGSNRVAAELSGIRVNRVRVGVLVFNGFAAALAGMMAVSQVATADPNVGIGYELDVIAAVIIGGAKLGGGAGTVLGSVLGILLIGMIRNGLVIVGVSIYLLIIVSGLIVVVAVAIDRFVTSRTQGGGGIRAP
jgi:ribose transport system permease protein